METMEGRKLLLLFDQENGDQGADLQQIGVEAVAHDLESGEGSTQLSGCGDGHQHLGTVGDDALEDTVLFLPQLSLHFSLY